METGGPWPGGESLTLVTWLCDLGLAPPPSESASLGMGLLQFGLGTPQQLCFLPLPQLSLFFDILLCMARNVSREDFLAGRPPEIGQGDTDVAGYLQSARAELWRELRDQPLTMGGYCLSALQGGETMEVRTPE